MYRLAVNMFASKCRREAESERAISCVAQCRAACGAIAVTLCCQILPVAHAATMPCEPATYAQVKQWKPGAIITKFCIDQAEADRLATSLTSGSQLRSVVQETEARLDICDQQTALLRRVLSENVGRRMPPCDSWR
jgi:hypothetical protein